jgi:uncharacterized RDD family membrane protein YckC
MDRKEKKGSSEAKTRYVWDPKKLAWVEITEPEVQESVTERSAVEPKPEEVSEEVKAETRAEEVPGEVAAETRAEEVLSEAAVEGAPAKGAVEAGGLQYRGVGLRLLAFIVDGIVLLIISYLLNVATGTQIFVNTASNKIMPTATWHQWVFLVILIAYFAGFWAWRGQTPGKMLVGAKIVKKDGSDIGIVRSLLRFIGYFLYLVVVALTGTRLIILIVMIIFGLIIVVLNKRKQGIHDFIAGTVVINSRRKELEPAEAVEDVEVAEATEETAEPLNTSEPGTDKTEQDK